MSQFKKIVLKEIYLSSKCLRYSWSVSIYKETVRDCHEETHKSFPNVPLTRSNEKLKPR